mmetsp:Transcript_12761/g.17727  ORF Transcript_12761/g.17727 Transcript_12761/m.17727 type:complete len:114 (-) Transcript_12761:217-558(-)
MGCRISPNPITFSRQDKAGNDERRVVVVEGEEEEEKVEEEGKQEVGNMRDGGALITATKQDEASSILGPSSRYVSNMLTVHGFGKTDLSTETICSISENRIFRREYKIEAVLL